jgi:hypothetical protein
MNRQNTEITVPTGDGNISSLRFHGYASEFAKYAREAEAGQGRQFSPVTYYLYCHSLELVLKAFLLAKSVPMAELPTPGLRHDLEKILQRAKGLGLEQTVPLAAHWEPEVHKANAYYNNKEFEYFDLDNAGRGYPNLPALDVLNEMVTRFLADLKQVCDEA